MSDYMATTTEGKSWRRAFRVEISNPLDMPSTIHFIEQDVVTIGDKTFFTQLPPQLTAIFDVSNPLHLDIYNKLNELYILLREQRDIPGQSY